MVERNARYLALWTSRTSLVLPPFIWFGFERGTAEAGGKAVCGPEC